MDNFSEQASICYRRSDKVISREISGETILVPIRKGTTVESLYTLDEIGSFIWNLLDGQHTQEQVIDAVVIEYAVTRDKASADLVNFIKKLEAFDVVVKV
jgi:hypothetical protein